MKAMEETTTNLSVNVPVMLDPARIAALVEQSICRISCELRDDYRCALESIPSSRRAAVVLNQLVDNARIAATEGLPLCQDTGYVWVLLEVGGDVLVPADIFKDVDAAVARAYEQAGLRKSLVHDALLDRSNTGDNTPAFCEIKTIPSAQPYAHLSVMLKGGGSDNASRVTMLSPGVGISAVRELVLNAVFEKGANACPPLVVGVGVGSTFDKVAGLAKHALLRKVGSTHPQPAIAELEEELLKAINGLGIGPGGFGGYPTALAVHIETASCHIAALPVAVNIGCSALRSITFDVLAGDGAKTDDSQQCRPGLDPGSSHALMNQEMCPTKDQQVGALCTSPPKRLDLPATAEQLVGLRAGDEVALFGTVYTMRDAGHLRALEHLNAHGELPYGLNGQALFYAGPTEPKNGYPCGAVGPTTASRMDFATPALLDAGITVTLGKGRRAQAVVDACARCGCIYLAATGGAAAYLAQFVTEAELVAWQDLGTEALRRLTLEGFPAFVAIDTTGATLWDEAGDAGAAEIKDVIQNPLQSSCEQLIGQHTQATNKAPDRPRIKPGVTSGLIDNAKEPEQTAKPETIRERESPHE